jgi:putative membrane protein
MSIAAAVFTGLVALLHGYFLVLECFLWTKPQGLKTFRMTPAQAEATAVLAKNQGTYNGFLAAGLVWSLVADATMVLPLRCFFLGCVIVAALVGAATVSPRILAVQGGPAVIALALSFAAAM